jgi:small subunit ribosomal protein S16
MLRIRLTRVGKKRQPYYRVVVADAEAKRDGRIVENIGHYTALTDPITFKIQEDRALYWLSVGAQPSDAVRRLLEKQGTMERLARLKAGEPLEILVAEVAGSQDVKAKVKPAAVVEEPTVDDQAGAVVEEIEEAGKGLLDDAKEVVDNTVEALGETASQVAEAVGAAIGTITEEE